MAEVGKRAWSNRKRTKSGAKTWTAPHFTKGPGARASQKGVFGPGTVVGPTRRHGSFPDRFKIKRTGTLVKNWKKDPLGQTG